MKEVDGRARLRGLRHLRRPTPPLFTERKQKLLQQYYKFLITPLNQGIELGAMYGRACDHWNQNTFTRRPVAMGLTTKIIIIKRIVWAVSQLAMLDKPVSSLPAIVCDELSIAASLYRQKESGHFLCA